MFLGKYYYTLEQNGRVSLPKAFRDECATWVITRGLDGGLLLVPEEGFRQEISSLATRTFTKKIHRDFIRLMTNEAVTVSPDKQGRVQLPEYLIKLASLTKDLVIVGSLDKVEIWNAKKYHTYLSQIEPESAAIAEQLIPNN